jgi:hypothetical protein
VRGNVSALVATTIALKTGAFVGDLSFSNLAVAINVDLPVSFRGCVLTNPPIFAGCCSLLRALWQVASLALARLRSVAPAFSRQPP